MSTAAAPIRTGLGHVRILADKSKGRKFCPDTGKPKDWPCAGLRFTQHGESPLHVRLSHRWVLDAVAKGLMRLPDGKQFATVVGPAGPASDPWKKSHNFPRTDAATIDLMVEGGDWITYQIVAQPGKRYADGTDVAADLSRYGEPATTTWHFDLDLQA